MKHPELKLLLITFIFPLILFGNSFSQTRLNEHPLKGSIQFGARDQPITDSAGNLSSIKDIFIKVAKKVTPCVVAVLPTKIDTIYKNPFDRFYNDDGEDGFVPPADSSKHVQNGSQTQEKRTRKTQALGSGVIVSSEGYILTNFHVISGASEIEVHLSDGRSFQAKIAGADSLSDVAVIKITGAVPKDLPVAYLGNSDSLQPGAWVAAVGNPFNLISTVTVGIISALNRQIEPDSAMYQNFIQTDAAINPGNSGGALVNIYGEVVGINTLIFSKTGGFMGIGFAIPINMARNAMEDLIYNGKVVRGWIGVSIQDLDNIARTAIGLEEPGGALISDVFKDQPADKSGIKRGDIVLSINNSKIADPNDLRNIIAMARPGNEIPVVVIRNNKKFSLMIKVVERTDQRIKETNPKQYGNATPPPPHGKINSKVGIAAAELNSEIRSQYNLSPDNTGVVITGIDPTLTDSRSSFSPGDIILEAKAQGKSNQKIYSTGDWERFINGVKKGQAVLVLATRHGATFYVPFLIK